MRRYTRRRGATVLTRAYPLLVGLCPHPDDSAERPLDGLSGARLASFARLVFPSWLRPSACTPADLLLVYYDLVNLWPVYTAERPAAESRHRAEQIDCSRRVVVLLGREVQRAFKRRLSEWPVAFYDWCAPADGDGAQLYVCIPHPSGLNRVYNRREYRRTTGRVLRRALEGAA